MVRCENSADYVEGQQSRDHQWYILMTAHSCIHLEHLTLYYDAEHARAQCRGVVMFVVKDAGMK